MLLRQPDEGNNMRDQKAKEALIRYLQEHPEQRLWQCIRNWSGFNFIWAGDKLDMSDASDTFYEEYKKQK